MPVPSAVRIELGMEIRDGYNPYTFNWVLCSDYPMVGILYAWVNPAMIIDVHVDGENLAITFPYDQILVEKIKSMPQRRWDKKNGQWICKPSLANLEYLKHWFPHAEWSGAVDKFIDASLERKEKREAIAAAKASADYDFSVLDGIKFLLPLLEHQKIALLLGRDMPHFAYLMDQGTGKTKVVIDDAAHNYRQGRITGMVVFAPNSVKSNWVDPSDTYPITDDPLDMDEITKHMAPDVPINGGSWVSSPTRREREIYKRFRSRWGEEAVLHVLVVNVEALYVKRVVQELTEFVTTHQCMAVCDESTRIKNRAAKRTKNAIKIRDMCPMARIMSGTPLIKSPLDAFAQFRFLDEDIEYDRLAEG